MLAMLAMLVNLVRSASALTEPKQPNTGQRVKYAHSLDGWSSGSPFVIRLNVANVGKC